LIPLAIEATVAGPGTPPRPLGPVKLANGTVTVAEPPVPACFFYMH
jgi:hypothetical protein